MSTISVPYSMIVAVPLSVYVAVSALTVLIVFTALGHLVGSCYQEPRNNAGAVLGFIQGLLVITLAGALIRGSAGDGALLGALSALWLFYALYVIGAIH